MLCPLVPKRRNHAVIRMMKPEAAFLYDPFRFGERYLMNFHCFYFIFSVSDAYSMIEKYRKLVE